MKKAGPIIVVIVLILVIAFGIGQFFAVPVKAPGTPSGSGQSAPAAPATQVVVYEPSAWASSTPAEQGSCWTSSIAAPFRSDAWRCSVGNAISDPCFQIPGSAALLCGANPAVPSATSSFVLHLMKPLPKPEVPPGSVPADWAWLIQLADGTVCSPFTGTLPITQGGVAASYGCAPKTPGAEGLLIFGDLNTSSSAWTAETGGIAPARPGELPAITNKTIMNVATVWQ